VLCKVLAHNIVCVAQAAIECGIEVPLSVRSFDLPLLLTRQQHSTQLLSTAAAVAPKRPHCAASTGQSVHMDAAASARGGQSLFDTDRALAERMAARLVDRFLTGAGLSATHRAVALAQTEIFVSVDGDGSRTIDIALPLGSGNPGGFEWDGSIARAEEIAEAAADGGIEDVLWDQKNVGLTGWEPQFDDPT
jgi:hypothetical protein